MAKSSKTQASWNRISWGGLGSCKFKRFQPKLGDGLIFNTAPASIIKKGVGRQLGDGGGVSRFIEGGGGGGITSWNWGRLIL